VRGNKISPPLPSALSSLRIRVARRFYQVKQGYKGIIILKLSIDRALVSPPR